MTNNNHHIGLFLMKGMVMLFMVACMVACSATKYVDDDHYLLDKVKITADDPEFNTQALNPYIRQKTNAKWFSLFKLPLHTYSLSGRDTTKWINRMLRNIGEPPVLYDTLQAQLTCQDLTMAMKNMGYLNATVSHARNVKGRKVVAEYQLHPGEQYYIRKVNYDIRDDNIRRLLQDYDEETTIVPNTPFSVNKLEQERKQLTNFLTDNGYYRFHKDYIRFDCDTARGQKFVDLTLHLFLYQENNNVPTRIHPKYTIRNVNFRGNEEGEMHLRRSVLENNSWLIEGQPYKASNVQRTYNNFARLNAVKATNIRLSEVPDTTLLDCDIQVITNRPSTISFSPEGTNTAGDLGAAATLTYENRNLFKGSETFSVQLRGAFEAITELEGYSNENYIEYGVQANLQFPRFVAPFLSSSFKRNSRATSEVALSYNLQNRPEFHRRVFAAGWRYRWNDLTNKRSYKLDLIDLNYIYMPWISSTFKSNYLDDVTNRNAILRYNYEDLFIMKIGLGMTYNNRHHVVRANLETAGNLLQLAAKAFSMKKNDNNQYTLFNIAYAQYVKADVDYTKIFQFDDHNSLVLHAALGIAYPYGNSKVLPFEKRYFSGGANSVRGWGVRRLGPGKYKGNNGAIDFINQTGDMKLDLNLEYRTFLFWKINGALFIDAGNIWTLREYEGQPGGQFKWDEFYKQIAVAYGLGLRLNFDYFILRFDMGMKAINPAYDSDEEHFAIIHPKLSRDFSFHFAVGLPF